MSLLDAFGNVAGSVKKGIGEVAQGVGKATTQIGELLSEEQSKDEGGTVKCPYCGETLQALSSVCPACGHELQGLATASSVSRLAQDIYKLESRRNIKSEARQGFSQTDENIASLVRNFVVPNSKEDIFEFMLMASGNLDAYRGKTTGNPKVVVQAWEAKFEQTYLKAQTVFGEHSDFQKIQGIYDAQRAKATAYAQERESGRSLFRRRRS